MRAERIRHDERFCQFIAPLLNAAPDGATRRPYLAKRISLDGQVSFVSFRATFSSRALFRKKTSPLTIW
jgi:hypothetical protein